MNEVQPIRDKEIIAKFKNKLLKKSYRDYMLFVFGINTGLRISDILPLRVKDVTGTVLDANTVLFNLDYQQLQKVGTYRAVISLHKGADILTSDLFKFRVEANLLREGE